MLNHNNPVHDSPSLFLKIYFNIILSSTPRYSKWSVALRYLYHTSLCTFPVPHTCHMSTKGRYLPSKAVNPLVHPIAQFRDCRSRSFCTYKHFIASGNHLSTPSHVYYSTKFLFYSFDLFVISMCDAATRITELSMCVHYSHTHYFIRDGCLPGQQLFACLYTAAD